MKNSTIPYAPIIATILIIASLLLIPGEPSWTQAMMLRLRDSLIDYRDWLDLGKMFADTQGMIIIGLLIVLMDSRWKEILCRLIPGCLFAFLNAAVLKFLFSRERPEFDRREDFAPEAPIEGMGEFFAGWGQGIGQMLDSDYMSYPSGHSLFAVFFACGLAYYYPRVRGIFYALATLCMIQRITSAHHFLSDTFAGAGLGIIIWYIVQKTGIVDGIIPGIVRFFKPDFMIQRTRAEAEKL